MKIKNKKHLVETLAGNIQIVEEYLTYVDSEIKVTEKLKIDILALDKSDRIVIIIAKDDPQTLRANKGINILKESTVLWDWVSDLKDDYSLGIEQKTGKKPAKIPPRLFLIAPSFEQSLLSLVKHVAVRIDIDVFTFDPQRFQAVKNSLTKVDVLGLPDASKNHIKALDQYHDSALSGLREAFEKIVEAQPNYVAYKPKL